ncbi:MAG: hypothetical protein JWM11_1530 [Planctomycetaceae bacterium]|nr:hypothetical protein [Planctomycetaceae bacterium]
MWGTLQNLWDRVKPFDCATQSCTGFHDLNQLPAEISQSVSDSYPPNHNYSVVDDRLLPSRKLGTRVAHFRKYYPRQLTSLLDLSCSKGFFVFDAARESTCERALGIDLCDKTLATCRQLKQHFEHSERVSIEKLSLAELACQIDAFGGTFETALLVNTYQYLFFGSPIAPALSRDHCEIFRQIRRVCHGRVIFHNRVTLNRVQKHIRETADGAEWGRFYTPEAIRSAASEFFRVTELPVWGGHPVWLLDAL